MLCPVCNQRKGKRACPAIGKQICAVCCGTKRLVEIRCPSDCGYLASARVHPPAILQRQQEVDRAMLLPLLQSLSERQARAFLMLAAVTARHKGEILQKLVDEDIAQAAGALAETLEIAGRGIVYEHQPTSLPAARLMSELRTLADELAKTAGSGVTRDVAIALRRLEHGAKMMAAVKPNGNEFQHLLNRALAPPPGSERTEPETPPAQASSLIIP
jgi:hypothetical protein